MNKPKAYSVAVIALTVLLACSLLFNGIQATVPSGGPYYLQVPTSTWTYLIDQFSNGTYYMVNCTNWNVDYKSTNLTKVAQFAVDNASALNGGIIYFKEGIYTFTAPLIGKNSVALVGEIMGPYDNFTVGTVFNYTGASTDPFLDFRDCPYVNIRNLKIINAGASLVGIRLGSQLNLAATRTKCSSLNSITIQDFATGIKGDTFGPDDSSLYEVFIGDATTCAIDHVSSQMKMFGGSIFGTCAIGVRITRDEPTHPDTGMEFYGTVWSGPDICVDFTGDENSRGAAFYGTWMENCATMLVRMSQTTDGIYVAGVSFYNCFGYTNTGATAMFDLSGVHTSLTWLGGELWPADDPTQVITNGTASTTQVINIQPFLGGPRINYTDSNNGRVYAHSAVLSLYDSTPFGESTTLIPSAWAVWATNSLVPWHKLEIKRVRIVVSWNPESTGAGFRLEYPENTVVTGSVSEPGVNGYRTDTLDITTFARANMDYGGSIVNKMHGNDTTAPRIYRAILIYEW